MQSCELIMLVSTIDDVGATSTITVLAILLGLLAGIIKCFRIMRRQETHSLCVVSLAVCLTAIFSIFATGLALRMGWIGSTGQMAAIPAIVLATIIACILAVVGLVEYRKHREAYTQGRSQAWWALVLSMLPIAIYGYGAWTIVRYRMELANGDSEVVGDLADLDLSTLKGDTQRLEQFNCEITPQGAAWVQMDAARVNPHACAAYITGGPSCTFVMIAERVGVEQGIDNETLMEVVKANLKSAGTVEYGPVGSSFIAGIDGLQMQAVVTTGANRMKYVCWIASYQGIVYQLISTAEEQHATVMRQRHASMLNGFRLLDDSFVAHTDGFEGVAGFTSEPFGYQLDLHGGEWHAFPDGEEFIPAVEFRAGLANRAVLAVMGLELPSIDPSWDDLSTGFGVATIPEFDLEKRRNLREFSIGAMRGLAFDYSDQDVQRRVRILRHEQLAVALAGWAGDDGVELLPVLERAMDGIQLGGSRAGGNTSGSEAERHGRSTVFNELGIAALVRHEIETAKTCFREATALNPQDVITLTNYLRAFVENGEPGEALAELEKRLPLYNDAETLKAWRARLLDQAGDVEKSREAFEELFRNGYQDEDDLLTLIGMQLKDEDAEAALETVNAYLVKRPSPAAQAWKAQVLLRKGDFQAGIDVLKELHAKRPRDAATLYDLADAHELAGQYTTALELCQQLADLGKKTEDVHLLRGRCQLGLKWYNEARDSFEEALAVNPRSEEAERWISLAAGMLGQGNTTWIKTPIDAVAMPAEIQRELDQLPARDAAALEFGAFEAYRVVGFDYVADKHWKSTTYRKVKVLTQEGVDRYSSLSVLFDPLVERVFVNRLVVYDEAGKLVAEGDVNDYYVQADGQDEMATGDHTLTVPAPQLKPGYTLEFAFSREYLGASDEFGFETVLLASTAPQQLAAAFVVGDVDKLSFGSSGPAAPSAQGGGGMKYWIVKDSPAYVYESYQPPLEEFLPVINIGDAGRTWEQVGAKYLEKIAARLEPDPAATEAAVKVTAGLETPEEKIAAIARYVQKQIAYQAIEFGVRGQMPNKPARTLEMGYGDCKDHALLLKQMLEAAGVTAHLTLVRVMRQVDEAIPSMDQFDHLIVSIPPADGERSVVYLDCTAKHADPALTLATDRAGQTVLVLDPKQPRVEAIAARPAGASEMRCTREVVVEFEAADDTAADAVVREDLWFSPSAASGYRAMLAAYEPRDRKTMVADILRNYEKVDIAKLEVENLEAPSEPLILHMEYRVKNAFHQTAGTGGALVGRIPSPWESHWAEVDVPLERMTPFLIPAATLESQMRVVLPPGYKEAERAAPKQPAEAGRFLRWDADEDPSTGESNLRATQIASSSSADEFAEYGDEGSALMDFLRRPVTLEQVE